VGNPGIVALENNLNNPSTTDALTAQAGKRLQDQIGNLDTCIVPNHQNIVVALNDLQQQSNQQQLAALIWCGYYNAQEGDISYVSINGQRLGYQVGEELPVSSTKNGGDFFIVTTPGNPYVGGDYNAPDQFLANGDWIVSEVGRWSAVDAAGELVASAVKFTPVGPLTATNVQSALNQVSQLFRTGIGGASVSSDKPANPYPGQLWWDNDDGLFYVFYSDINGSQWVEAGGGGSQSLQGAGGGVVQVDTGEGLIGGPITSTGTISLAPAVFNSVSPTASTLGGVIPRFGFKYNSGSGYLDLSVTSDFTGRSPITAFSQEGASLLNSKIESLSGSNTLAGTYDASTGSLVYVTPIAQSKGFIVGENLPPPSPEFNNYYVIVTVGGDQGPEGPQVSKAGDWYICEADEVPNVWFLIDYNQGSITAANVNVTPIPGIDFAGDVQSALTAIQTEAEDRIQSVVPTSGGLTVNVTAPTASVSGTTLEIGVDSATVDDKGIVQLTNDYRGNSETLAVTQYCANLLDSKIESLTGALVFAGTYSAALGQMVQVSPAGETAGFAVGQQAPAAGSVPDNYYIIVTQGGGFGPPGSTLPAQGVQAGDWFIVQNNAGFNQWITIDYDQREVSAVNVDLSPVPNLTATNVQTGLEEIQDEIESAFDSIIEGSGITVVDEPNPEGFGQRATISVKVAETDDIGGVFVPVGGGLEISEQGALTLAQATSTNFGGIRVGDNLSVDSNGRLSAVVPPTINGEMRNVDDISNQFDGGTSTFVLKNNFTPLPSNVTQDHLFITLNGTLLTPLNDYIYDSQNSRITFTFDPAQGSVFSGRVMISVPVLDNYVVPGVTNISFEGPLTGGTINSSGTVGITAATSTQRGTMSAADKAKMDLVGSNGFGNRTVSTELPSGGEDGDIWFLI
jgi:hypothetical protein